MNKFVRLASAAALSAVGLIAATGGVAQASASIDITFAVGVGSTLTVGETNVPITVAVTNNNDGGEATLFNTICEQGSSAPCNDSEPYDAPGISFVPSCGGLESECTVPDVGVFSLSATGVGTSTNTTNATCNARQFNIILVNEEFGVYLLDPVGPADIVLQPDETCTISFTGNVINAPTIDQDPQQVGLQTAQYADVKAKVGENVTLTAFDANTDNHTIQQAVPTFWTTASPDVPLAKGTLSDTATLTGRINPLDTGTVTFSLYGPNDSTCTKPPVFTSTKQVSTAANQITSDPYTPTAPGAYRWVARYSGDRNNVAVSGACNDANESVTVTIGQPTITTQASASIVLGQGTLTDTATLLNTINLQSGGTIDFKLYGPNDETCSKDPIFTSMGVPVPTDGSPVSSTPFTPTLPGTYRWVAEYSGDAYFAPAKGKCGDSGETVEVTKAVPTIATTSSGDLAIGSPSVDKATVSGRLSPADATIDFRLYGPDDATCSTTPVFEDLGVAYSATATTVESQPFTPTKPGVYRWVASYSGDANNSAAVGKCGDPAETFTVKKATPAIRTTASGSVQLPTGVLTDTATIVNGAPAGVSGTVSFRLYGPNDPTCSTTPVFEDLNVAYSGSSVTSRAFLPTAAGIYRWVATYSGDEFNESAVGQCGDSSETVEVIGGVTNVLPETGGRNPIGILGLGSGFAALGLGMVGMSRRRKGLES